MTRALRCFRCGRPPVEIPEYCGDPALTPDEYVWEEEGTLNKSTGLFACTECYIEIGMPIASPQWTPRRA